MIDPGESFRVVAANIPEPEERSRQLHGTRTVVYFQPIERGAKIVLIGCEIIGGARKRFKIPGHLPDCFSPDDPVSRKAAEDRVFFTRLAQFFASEILNCLQHSISWLGR